MSLGPSWTERNLSYLHELDFATGKRPPELLPVVLFTAISVWSCVNERGRAHVMLDKALAIYFG